MLYYLLIFIPSVASLVTNDQRVVCKEGSVTYNSLRPRIYYVCIGGQWLQQFCPYDQIFDYYTRRCKPKFVPPPSQFCRNGEKRPKLDNPKQYWYCNNRYWEIRTCPENSLYNVISQDCKFESPDQRPTCKEGSVTYNRLKPRVYYVCIRGRWVQQICPYNQVFDYETKRCKPKITPSCKSGEKRPNLDNPKQFFYCVKGSWVLAICPRNTMYNPISQACETGPIVPTPTPQSPVCIDTEQRPNNNNPSQFWYCDKGVWVLGQCQKDSLYNPTTRTCEPQSPPSPQGTCKEGEHKPKMDNPRQWWFCQNGKWIIRECPGNMVYNPIKNVCEVLPTPPPIACIEGQKRPKEGNPTQFWLCEKGRWVIKQCEEGRVYNSVTQKCENVAICVEGTQKSYPFDKHLYFKCVDGTWVRLACPNDEMFNEETNMCEGIRPTPPPQCTEEAIKPNPFNPYQYLQCSDGKWVLKDCPPNQIFDRSKNLCVPSGKDCIDGTFLPDLYQDNRYFKCVSGLWIPSVCSDNQIYNRFNKTCQSQPPKFKGCIDKTLLPDLFNNHQYFICNRYGTWVLVKCEGDKVFNFYKSSCEVILNPRPAPSEECVDGDVQPDLYNSNQYLDCIEDHWVTGKCPHDWVYYPSTKTCKAPSPRDLHGKECSNNSVEPDFYNRQNYFICIEGIWQTVKCPDEKVFNPKINSCDNGHIEPTPKPAECTEGQVYFNDLNPTQYFQCTNGMWTVKYCPPNQLFNRTSNTCQPKPLKRECAEGGVMPDMYAPDSNRYFSCVNGSWNFTYCSEPFIFNLINRTCQLPPFPVLPPNKDCFEGTVLLDLYNPRQYFKCESGVWKIRNCNYNQVYNFLDRQCQDTPNPPTPTTVECTNGTTQPDPYSFEQYFLCIGNKWTVAKCIKSYMYNPTRHSCEVIHRRHYCDEGSVFPDFYNHRQYFMCIDKVLAVLECPKDEFFNPTTNNCENIVVEPPAKCPEGAIQPNEFNILQYLLCSNGQWVVKECPINQIFNSTSLSCQPKTPVSTDCMENMVLPDFYLAVRYFQCFNGRWKTQECPLDKVFNVYERGGLTCKDKQDMHGPPGECNNINIQGDLYNPNQYFKCENNEWKSKKCPIREVYNLAKAYCVEDVNPMTPIPTEECIQGTQQPDLYHPQRYFICDGTNKWKSILCPNTGYNPKTVSCGLDRKQPPPGTECYTGNKGPNFYNHQMYFVCESGKWVSFVCQQGHFFNPTINTCESQLRPTPPTPICMDGSAQANPLNPSQYLQCINGHWVVRNCPSNYIFNITAMSCEPSGLDCTDGIMQPDLYNEHKYFKCVWGQWRVLGCPDNQFFNRITNVCKNQPSPSLSDGKTCFGRTVMPDLYNTNEYFRCHDGKWEKTKCANNQVYDFDRKTCEDNTNLKPLPTTECIVGSLLPDVYTSQQYFVCKEGRRWVTETCGQNQFYNQQKHLCDEKRPTSITDKECKEGMVEPNFFKNKMYFLCIDEHWVSLTCNGDQVFNPTLNSCQSPSKPPAEKCIENSKQPNLMNPSQYLLCQNGTWVVQDCPRNQVYNSTAQLCQPVQTDGFCMIGSTQPDLYSLVYYFQCEDDHSWKRKHCPEGQYYNRITGKYEARKTPLPADGKTCIAGTAFADLYNIKQYFKCDDREQWVVQSCSDNKVFNQATKNCQVNVHAILPPTTQQCQDLTVLPDLFNPYQYFTCDKNVWAVKRCSNGSGYHPTDTKCKIKFPNQNNVRKDGEFQPNFYDNREFFGVIEGKTVEIKCPERQIFSPLFNSCEDVMKLVRCDENSIRPYPGHNHEYLDCIKGKWVIKSCPHQQVFDSDLLQCKVQRPE